MEAFKAGLEQFGKNNNQDLTIFSPVSQKCQKKACYVGIDEAGRGPVLGPMVYGIFCALVDEESVSKKKANGLSDEQIENNPPTHLTDLDKLNDSKQVNEKLREELLQKMMDNEDYAFGLKFISPTQISSKCFKRQKCSLNEVSHDAAIELIRGMLDRGVCIEKVYVDTVGPMDKYQKKLENLFPDLKFKVDKKADSKYKPVSAASICAKVARDHALKNWQFPNGLEVVGKSWGSGYPGDPVTKKFLRDNVDPVFGFPNIVRNSWSTAETILKDVAVPVKWDEGEEDEAPAPKIKKYFTTSKKPAGDAKSKQLPVNKPKSQFFYYRNLEQTISF